MSEVVKLDLDAKTGECIALFEDGEEVSFETPAARRRAFDWDWLAAQAQTRRLAIEAMAPQDRPVRTRLNPPDPRSRRA